MVTGELNTDAGNVLNEDYDGEVLGQAFPTLELGMDKSSCFWRLVHKCILSEVHLAIA